MSRVVAMIAGILLAATPPLVALQPLVRSEVWLGATVTGVIASVVVLLPLRRWFAERSWPPLAALAAGFAAVVGLYGPSPSQEGWMRGLVATVVEGASVLRVQTPPVQEGNGVDLIIALAVLTVILAAESLAVGARSPALAGVPLLGLWVPHIVLSAEVPSALPLTSAGAYILLLALASPGSRLPRGILPLTAGITGLTLISAMLLTPVALSMPSWLGTSAPSIGGGATRLDLGLDIRSDLLRGSNIDLIRYQGATPAELGPLHSHTLGRFDGRRWHEDDEERTWLETSMLYPEMAPRMLNNEDVRQIHITIDELGQDRLFLPSSPRQLLLPGVYDPARDELYAPAGHRASYVLLGPMATRDPDVWHEHSRQPAAPTFTDRYLEVPVTSKSQDLAELTAEITAGADSPYQKAVAIQDFLRTDPRFTYTTSVPRGRSDDAVWDFLEHGEGYCVQFATAMVVMARIAGLPARMAVGFLPGRATTFSGGETGGVISSHDAHTWPQIFLGDAGWARFEPTPAGRAGPIPEFSRGLPSPSAPEQEPEEFPSSRPSVDVEDSPSVAPSTPAPSTEGDTESSFPRAGWVVAAAVIAAAVVAIGGLGRRRRRTEQAWGVEDYWRQAVSTLQAHGLHSNPSDTPLDILERARGLEIGSDLAALAKLTDAVNAHRYADAAEPEDEADLKEWLEETRLVSELAYEG